MMRILLHWGAFGTARVVRRSLAALTVLALVVPKVAAQTVPLAIKDLPQDETARRAITHIVNQGIMLPRSAGKFAPESVTSLGEYLISVQHMFSLPRARNPVAFTDVPASSVYYSAVQATSPYLARQVICFDCALSTNLYPEQPLTRAQAAITAVSILISRGRLKLPDGRNAADVLANVSDANNLSPPGRFYFATAISAGIVKSAAGHAIDIAHIETRSDIALMLDHVQTNFHLPKVRPQKLANSPGAPQTY
jgi:hypothetical protein